MKAALKTSRGDFVIRDVPKPEVASPNFVLAKVKTSGICGTDLRSWRVPKPELEGRIMGHELAGEVVEVGSAVGNVKKGDRVVIETVVGDGTCYWCRIQQYNLCPNLYEVRAKSLARAFAEYVAGPAEKFYELPDHVSYEEATLLDSYATSLHACHITELRMGDKIVVIGAGPIGLSLLELAKLAGAQVLVIDIMDFPLRVAEKLGADAVVNTSNVDGVRKVMEFTGGRGADIVYECAGGRAIQTTIPQATSFARRGGKVALVGGFDQGEYPITLDWMKLQKSEIQILPSASYAFWGNKPEMKMCLDLLVEGKLDAKSLMTHRFPFEKINDAFEVANDKEKNGSIFVVLDFGD